MRKKKMMNKKHYIKSLVMLATMMLAASCGSDDFDDEPQNVADNASLQEIRFNANVWRMMDGTRATTYDGGDLGSGSSFIAAAYVAGETTTYISPVQVNWDGDASKFIFSNGKHYWPMSDGLDFFAYMPVDPQSYITSGPSYTTARNPQFTCTMPMTNSGQDLITEFVYALKINQDKANQGVSGVDLAFQHPFTKIMMKLSSTQADIHIDKIIFKSIKKVGTYTHNSGWALSEDAAVNFEVTLDDDYEANADLGTFLMIPQAWAGQIEVNASWNDWGDTPVEHTVTATIPAITWQAGYSYTYTFTITLEDLVVNLTNFTEQW